MTTPAHLAGGYLIANALGVNQPLSLGLTVFFSVLPDIDYFWSRASDDHHHLVHTPVFWLIISALLFLASPIFPFLKEIITPLLLGTISHLILDFFAAHRSGIKMLFPFSRQEMSFFPLKKNILPNQKKYALSWAQTKLYYSSSHIFFSELSLVVTALIGFAFPSSGQASLL